MGISYLYLSFSSQLTFYNLENVLPYNYKANTSTIWKI